MTRSRFERAITSLRRQGIKYDLARMHILAERLGYPHRSYHTLHVTGTNGKGSTSAFLASALQAAGYRVGLNTSPHLVSFRERIRVDGRALDDDLLLDWFEDIRPLLDEVEASFFEAATALAFTAFERCRVDVAVIEVGLGGRLDASNVIEPLGSIITGVDLEHTRILGDTVEKIAAEKGGIIKSHPVVSGVRQPGARRVLSDIARERGATLTFVDEHASWTYEGGDLRVGPLTVTPGLKGRHQAENAALAVTLLDILHQRGSLDVPPSAREMGIAATRWPGRYDRQSTAEGVFIFDVAHNPSGARALADELGQGVGRPVNTVLGMLRDKPYRPVLSALRSAVTTLWVTTPDSERALDAAELASHARAVGYDDIRVEPDPAQAARAAASHAQAGVKREPVVVTGSLFTVGAAMDGLGLAPADQPGGLGLLAGSGS